MEYETFGTRLCEEAGMLLAEAFAAEGKTNILKESFGITFKEAGQTTANNSGAYTTLLSTTLYTAAIDKIDKILGLVEINEDLKNKGGFGAYQIPRSTPTIAYEVSEGAVTSSFDEGIDPVTVTCKKVVAGTSITWEIMKRGMTDFAKYVLKNAADAVSRKLASDIVNGLAAGAGGSETGGCTYDNVIDAEADVNAATYASNSVPYGFIADALVIHPTYWAVLRKDEDVKAAMHYASGVPGMPIDAQRMPLMFGNLELIVTPFLTAAQALVLERKRNLLIKESDLETFEGRIPSRLYDREVVALMSYVLAVIQPYSVSKITA